MKREDFRAEIQALNSRLKPSEYGDFAFRGSFICMFHRTGETPEQVVSFADRMYDNFSQTPPPLEYVD